MFITREKPSLALIVAVLVAVAFGLLSIFSAGMVLFGPAIAQNSAGAYANFVVWFNFLGGFAYVLAGYGLWNRQRWGVWLALFITVSIAAVSVVFGMHVASGAAYEMRTVAALGFRFVLWLAITAIAYVTIVRAR